MIQVAATFITETESKEEILRALSVLKSWNSEWKPAFFMVDYCQAEISALEDIFPGWYFKTNI